MSLRETLAEAEWRYPLLAGLVSGVTVALQYWRTPAPAEPVDATAVLLAGVFGGALFHGTGESTRIGLRTGLVAGVVTVPGFVRTFTAVLGLSQPTWFTLLQLLLGAVLLTILVGVSGVLGTVGAVLGNWLAAKTGPERPHSADG